MEKTIIECKFSISFPLKYNFNDKFIVTEDAVHNAKESLKNLPIVDKNDKVIGITDQFDIAYKHDEVVLIVKGKLWLYANPEIVVNKMKNNIISDFHFSGFSFKGV